MGHEFRVGLEDKTPLIHTPIYKLSVLELEKGREHSIYILENGLSNHQYLSIYLVLTKDDSL